MTWRPAGPLVKTILIHNTSHELDFIDTSIITLCIEDSKLIMHTDGHLTHIQNLEQRSSSKNAQSFHIGGTDWKCSVVDA